MEQAALGRRLHKLEIMIIFFSPLPFFFPLFCWNHSNAYNILSPVKIHFEPFLGEAFVQTASACKCSGTTLHLSFLICDLLFFFFFFWHSSITWNIVYSLEETSLLWGKLLILFRLSKCGIMRFNCFCLVKAISQNWNAAVGKTEFSRTKLAETNSNRILFKTLFCL